MGWKTVKVILLQSKDERICESSRHSHPNLARARSAPRFPSALVIQPLSVLTCALLSLAQSVFAQVDQPPCGKYSVPENNFIYERHHPNPT